MVVDSPWYSQSRPRMSDLPRIIKESRPIKRLVLPQQILIADPEGAIIAKSMLKLDHPLWRPLFAAIRPSTSPLAFTPRIFQEAEAVSIDLNSSHDGVSMAFFDAFALTPTSEDTCCAAKEELLVDFEKLVLPEVFLVEDICSEELAGYAASEVFDAFTGEASFDGCEVAVSFSICFLKKW